LAVRVDHRGACIFDALQMVSSNGSPVGETTKHECRK
jgi:hypothetical protein